MKFRAFLVHVFTASGLIPMMLSVEAIWQDNARLALIWLGIAMLIDGLDGPLARRFAVREHLPQIDGAILDHVIDFTGYCFLPALMVYHFALVPAGWAIAATSFMLMTALYTFANKQAKTEEYDFRGFPALWNVVVFYMIMFDSDPRLNLAGYHVSGGDDICSGALYPSAARGCTAPPDRALIGRLDEHGFCLFGFWPRRFSGLCQYFVLGAEFLFPHSIGVAQLGIA